MRTERLVYDHLLGPIELSWLAAGSQNLDQVLATPPAPSEPAASGRGGAPGKWAPDLDTDPELAEGRAQVSLLAEDGAFVGGPIELSKDLNRNGQIGSDA